MSTLQEFKAENYDLIVQKEKLQAQIQNLSQRIAYNHNKIINLEKTTEKDKK